MAHDDAIILKDFQIHHENLICSLRLIRRITKFSFLARYNFTGPQVTESPQIQTFYWQMKPVNMHGFWPNLNFTSHWLWDQWFSRWLLSVLIDTCRLIFFLENFVAMHWPCDHKQTCTVLESVNEKEKNTEITDTLVAVPSRRLA